MTKAKHIRLLHNSVQTFAVWRNTGKNVWHNNRSLEPPSQKGPSKSLGWYKQRWRETQNGGNLNVPATEGNELATSKAELETGEEPRWKTGSEVLCTKHSNESWAWLMKSVGQSDCNLVRKWNCGARSNCWKTATKTSGKGRADKGAGSKSADRLLNVRRVGGILKNLKSHG